MRVSNSSRRAGRILPLVVLALVAGMGTALVAVRPAREPLPHYSKVPAFHFVDSRGKAFDSSDLAGRTTVLSFFFTSCPHVCPVIQGKVRGLAQAFKTRPVQFVSISVDPENDTAEELAKYERKFSVDPDRWHMLTGEAGAGEKLSDALFLTKGAEADEHTDRLVLIDAQGVVRGYYSAFDSEAMERIKEDITALAVE